MAETCKNCAELIEANFCANCGQKKYKRINRKYILDEIQYTVLHTNKGLFYTLKNLLRNPGKTAREYIEGNRIHHYKPILLVFVIIGISTFISYNLLHYDTIAMDGMSKSEVGSAALTSDWMKTYMATVKTYTSFFMLALVPVFAFITKIAFRKWGQNYYEHVVMNCFILTLYTILTIILYYPLIFFLKDSPELLIKISMMQFIILPFVLFWFFKTFYVEKTLKAVFKKTLATVGISLVVFLVLYIILIFITLGVVLIINGPEGLKIFKPK